MKKVYKMFLFIVLLFMQFNFNKNCIFAATIYKPEIIDINKNLVSNVNLSGTKIYDLTNNEVIINQVNEEQLNAYRVIRDFYGNITGYDLLKAGIYYIVHGGRKLYYAFDKAGNMITGFAEYNGNRYLFSLYGDNIGAMVSYKAMMPGKFYLLSDDGRLLNKITNVPTWLYNINIGKYRYMIVGGETEAYVRNAIIYMDYKEKNTKYLFDKNGFLEDGFSTLDRNVYVSYNNGGRYGQLLSENTVFLNKDNIAQNSIFSFSSDNILDRVTILN